MAHADDVTTYAYVQQNGTKVTADGTASFTASEITMSFDSNGNAVMTIDSNTVATLPVNSTNGGQLCADFGSSASAGTKSVTVTDAGCGTLYSPFVLTVPDDVRVYAPTISTDKTMLNCTKINSGEVIPAGTALFLQKAGTYSFGINATAPTVTPTSALSGTAFDLTVDEESVLTLGKAITADTYGFYLFTGTSIPASKTYLNKSLVASQAKCVLFSFDDVTGVDDVNAMTPSEQTVSKDGKYIVNGKIVIVKGNRKYNLNGQEVK